MLIFSFRSSPPAARRSIADQLKYAIVWGTSAKHNRGQKVGLAHELQDEDGEFTCLFGPACRRTAPSHEGRRKKSALLIQLVYPDLQSCNLSSGSKSLVPWYILLQLILPIDLRGNLCISSCTDLCNINFSALPN